MDDSARDRVKGDWVENMRLEVLSFGWKRCLGLTAEEHCCCSGTLYMSDISA